MSDDDDDYPSDRAFVIAFLAALLFAFACGIGLGRATVEAPEPVVRVCGEV